MNKNAKKCLVLTMRLGANYGGIIQAYALQSVVKKMGFKTYTSTPSRPSKIRRCVGNLRRTIRSGYLLSIKEEDFVFQDTNKFIYSNIETFNFYDRHNKPNTKIRDFKNVIIGSDQVWRARYGKVEQYFAKNIPEDINRISYAASFGVGESSEYNTIKKRVTKNLIKKFKAVSVREDSGVKLCKEMWGVDAEQLVDPTLLIQKDEYVKLIEADKTIKSSGNLFAYILDRSDDKQIAIDQITKKLDLKPFEIMPSTCNSRKEFHKNPERFVLPPVTQWLQSFMDAKFIVTDSFHGCVFSIIFNKPFIAIGNEGRGLTRFISLLKVFKLENRLMLKSSELTDTLIFSDINWDQVNEIIKLEQARSTEFLNKNLKSEHDS